MWIPSLMLLYIIQNFITRSELEGGEIQCLILGFQNKSIRAGTGELLLLLTTHSIVCVIMHCVYMAVCV